MSVSEEFRPEDWPDIDDEHVWYKEDGPTCQVLSETRPKARKEYQCTLCKGNIAVGERYRRIFAVMDDGEPFTEKHCLGCEVMYG